MRQPNRLVYLIGVPGAGKTTVATELTRGWDALEIPIPVPHQAWRDEFGRLQVVTLGRARDTFGGTDTLSMSVQPKVVEWLTSEMAPKVVFGEGDRLANLKFFGALRQAEWQVSVVLLDTPLPVAAARRHQRGSNQDPRWLAGRITKIDNLAPGAVRLDGSLPPDKLGRQLRAMLNGG